MTNVLVNGFSAKSGGGKVIFDNYFNAIKRDTARGLNYFFLTSAEQRDICKTELGHTITIVEVPRLFRNKFALPLLYLYWLPKYCKKNSIKSVLNFGDLILPFIRNQIYFFDWAYLCVPESPVWSLMDKTDLMKRKLKISLIKLFFSNVTTVIVQSSSMKNRIENLISTIRCDVSSIEIIPTPIDFFTDDHDTNTLDVKSNLKKDTRWNNLLFLAGYAPHKNFDAIIPLLHKIKYNGLKYRICVTLPQSQKYSKKLLVAVEKEGLNDYFINLGVLDRKSVLLELSRSKALFLPTFLESYGIPYIEAMNANCTILTSDFDFVEAVCHDSAFYFDPLDTNSIFDSIMLIETRPDLVEKKKVVGKKISGSIINWNEFSERIETLLLQIVV